MRDKKLLFLTTFWLMKTCGSLGGALFLVSFYTIFSLFNLFTFQFLQFYNSQSLKSKIINCNMLLAPKKNIHTHVYILDRVHVSCFFGSVVPDTRIHTHIRHSSRVQVT